MTVMTEANRLSKLNVENIRFYPGDLGDWSLELKFGKEGALDLVGIARRLCELLNHPVSGDGPYYASSFKILRETDGTLWITYGDRIDRKQAYMIVDKGVVLIQNEPEGVGLNMGEHVDDFAKTYFDKPVNVVNGS